MSLKSTSYRAVAFGVLALPFITLPAKAQDAASIFTNLGRFVSGFDFGTVFVAPTGFVHSDVLKSSGHLQQVGIELRNPKLDISVSYDLLTGLRAKDQSLDLRGSVAAVPTIKWYHDTDLFIPGIDPTASFAVGVGLSELQNARATLPQSPANHAVKLTGSGYHLDASLALGVSFGSVGVYVENAYRYTRFPSLDWNDDKLIVPPAGWPTSMDFWTGTLRLGVALGAGPQKKPLN